MKAIQVEYNEFSNWPEEVPVLWKEDDYVVWCNHVDVDVEEADFGYANPISSDWVDSWHNIEVCQKCDSWRYADGSSDWERSEA